MPEGYHESCDAVGDYLWDVVQNVPVEDYLKDICTVNEIETLAQRQQVAFLLRDNLTYNEIEEKTGASTATISRVKRSLIQGGEGYEAAHKRLKGEK